MIVTRGLGSGLLVTRGFGGVTALLLAGPLKVRWDESVGLASWQRDLASLTVSAGPTVTFDGGWVFELDAAVAALLFDPTLAATWSADGGVAFDDPTVTLAYDVDGNLLFDRPPTAVELSEWRGLLEFGD
jgi:hypothetical protein